MVDRRSSLRGLPATLALAAAVAIVLGAAAPGTSGRAADLTTALAQVQTQNPTDPPTVPLRSVAGENAPGTPEYTRALAVADFNRSRAAGRAAATYTVPTIRLWRGVANLVLPARATAYTIPEIAAAFPVAIANDGEGTWFVQMHLVVGAGATLRIGGDDVRALRLRSDRAGYATIITVGGTIAVEGTAGQTVEVTSWNRAAAAPDTEAPDGRAFLLADPGRMDVAFARFHDLGFATGRTSGVAWHGEGGVSALGNVTDSLFQRNYFGAYTFDAVDMHWYRNAFVQNDVYGLDPHDASNRFDVAFNLFLDNGRNGLVFSRGCVDNVVRGNVAVGNGGAGIMIDDGHLAADGDPRHALVVPSDRNTVTGNLLGGNALGVSVDGGAANVVVSNLALGNATGIRGADLLAGNTFAGNVIVGSATSAIQIRRTETQQTIRNNLVAPGPRVQVTPTRDPLAPFLGKPALWLWSLVLGLPFLAWAATRTRRVLGAAAS